MNNIVILIPPSEGKASGGAHLPLKTVHKNVRHVISQWEGISRSVWQKNLGVKDKALDKAIESNRNILTSKTLPAIERYSGVVYNAINYPTMSGNAKDFLNEHVHIVSAVFGFVKPQDLIPDYKCKITNFSADKFWKPIHTEYLNDKYVIDLLPQAHKKAISYTSGITIEFSILKNGKKIPAGHQGKHIKGRFIRWLCEQQSAEESTIKKFKEDGFRWSQEGFFKEG